MKSLTLPLELNPLPRFANAANIGGTTTLAPFVFTARRKSSDDKAAPAHTNDARRLLKADQRAARWEHTAFAFVAGVAALPLIYGVLATRTFALNFGKLLEWVHIWGL